MTQSTSARWRIQVAVQIVVIAIGLVGAVPIASEAYPAPNKRLVQSSPYLERSHVITFNIRGGDGNAVTGYNADATLYNHTNTVQSRIRARWPYAQSIGLQEVCHSNWNLILLELAAFGYTAGPGGYRWKSEVSLGMDGTVKVGTGNPSNACGDWYGNGVLVRGAITGSSSARYGSQQLGGYNEKRSWVCVYSLYASCTTHLQAGDTSKTAQQASQYRDLANLHVGVGLTTFAGGDFNSNPGLLTLGWALDSWSDPDQHSGGMQVTHGIGNVLDYIWKKNSSTWYADAYIGTAYWSDHHLKQGYF